MARADTFTPYLLSRCRSSLPILRVESIVIITEDNTAEDTKAAEQLEQELDQTERESLDIHADGPLFLAEDN